MVRPLFILSLHTLHIDSGRLVSIYKDLVYVRRQYVQGIVVKREEWISGSRTLVEKLAWWVRRISGTIHATPDRYRKGMVEC